MQQALNSRTARHCYVAHLLEQVPIRRTEATHRGFDGYDRSLTPWTTAFLLVMQPVGEDDLATEADDLW